jgi:secreted trypsin-like serine protease
LDNDVALLHLSTKSAGAHARILSEEEGPAITEGATTIVVGWGDTAEGGETSNVLRQVSVPIVNNDTCRSFEDYGHLTENMFCAGNAEGGQDACQGDSGGPIFMMFDGTPTQVGIVSWGIGCARPNAPGVYTRLSRYVGWVRETTAPANE